ncbi:hypothetical protein AKJ09_06876 [Labilithrix luteola]|uniref:Uncharacterized protein n=1 Tax=Labilithrix luteola TaxID=1391654 RepID=A0A0K1Q3B3_9BACT|nr:hypothetical protein [Labilithrix luteola]AKV00213.1 hypothetical protein AKJ09_06876 [Labilithrix luteola]
MGQPVVRSKIVVRADAAGGLCLVHTRRVTMVDRMTAREREMAEAAGKLTDQAGKSNAVSRSSRFHAIGF